MLIRIIAQILYTIDLLIETIISLRFIFKLFGASEANAIVRWIYEISGAFISPFEGIITANWHIGSLYIDVNALVALVVYMLVAFVLIEIVKAFTPRKNEN